MCFTPFYKTDKELGLEFAFPCGKCPNCVARRISQWSFRIMQEERLSSAVDWITLTYDTREVPITDKGLLTLDKEDVQLFMKRLRKRNERKLKYYVVGEYGEEKDRPHYHMILFNAKKDTIQPAWQKGEIHYGTCTPESIGYSLGYMYKQRHYVKPFWDDRQEQFALMSKKLGAGYITDKMITWHKNDLENRMYCNLPDGKKIAMPRYYKQKIYDEDERQIIARSMVKKISEEIEEYNQNNSESKILADELDKEAAIYAAFQRMYKNSTKNKKL